MAIRQGIMKVDLDNLLEDIDHILKDNQCKVYGLIDALFEQVNTMAVATDKDNINKLLVNYNKFISGLDLNKQFYTTVINVKYNFKDPKVNTAVLNLFNSVKEQIENFTDDLDNINKYIRAKLGKLG